MSGGYFDHESLRVGTFANILEQELIRLNNLDLEDINRPSIELLSWMSDFHKQLSKMSEMCRHIEWTLSGDHSWATLEGLIKDYEGATLGPQKSPSSVAKIQAETKQVEQTLNPEQFIKKYKR